MVTSSAGIVQPLRHSPPVPHPFTGRYTLPRSLARGCPGFD